MFFIFGWNHQEIKQLGPVEQHNCKNCNNVEYWSLDKVSRYFTLFFIPIFPHDSDYWYHCPICNFGTKLNSLEIDNYKTIAKVNTDYLNKLISEEDRKIQLDKVYDSIEIEEKKRSEENLIESTKWDPIVSKMSTFDLKQILEEKRNEYNPAFLIATEKEIQSRGY
jgi:hypothetical protein